MITLIDTDGWQEIWETIRRNKLRAFMTAAGVFWGIFMLVALLGAGNGLENGVRKQFGMQTNSVYVWGQRTTMPYKGMKPARPVKFDIRDLPALKALPGLLYLAPRLQLGGWRDGNNVVRGNKTGNFTVMGDFPEIHKVEPFIHEAGRLLNQLDVRDSRKVALIGKQVREVLFGSEDPIGQHIKIKGVYFQIIGVYRSSDSGDDGERKEQTILVPFTTFQATFNAGNEIGWFAMAARPDYDATKLEREVKQILAERHSIHPDDPAAIGSFNVAQEFEKMMTFFVVLKSFVWFVGVMTLLAGVLGVSNIMLIVVKERTREIGVRRAIGATPSNIVRMVLREAVFLTAVAGYTGLCAAVGLLELARRNVGDNMEFFQNPGVDFNLGILATMILIFAGGIAGIIPARHAVAIRPVVALRAD